MTEQTNAAVQGAQGVGQGPQVPPTTQPGVAGSATPQLAPQDAPQTVPATEFLRLQQQRERDVAAVKAAEQRRASMYQQQLERVARENAQLKQQMDQFQSQVVQREMQALPPADQEKYRMQLAAYDLKKAYDALGAREQQVSRKEAERQAVQLRDKTAREWILLGVPANALDYSGPEQMRMSAMRYIQQRQLQTAAPSRVTGSGSAMPPPVADLQRITQMSYAERQAAYKRLDAQARGQRNRR